MRTIPISLTLAFLLAGCGGGGETSGSDAVAAGVPTGTQNTTGTTVGMSTPTERSTAAPAAPLAPLGVNLEALTDYSRLPPFVDMMKLSRHWGTPATPWDKAAPVDSRGWPTADAGVVIVSSATEDRPDPGDNTNAPALIPQGTYKLAFAGRATVTAVASRDVRVANTAYDPATKRSTADILVGPTAYQLILSFTGTSSGVRDVTLLRPGYTNADTFTREFKSAVAPFGTLRFMDFLATNNNPVSTWAERKLPTDATQAGPKGGAYEYPIQIANELGKDIWLNIPVGADDDFVRQLATLLDRSLAPDRIVYLEYSNELWNWIFTQSGANMDAAIAEVVAGDTSLVNGAGCTQDQMVNGTDACNKYWAAHKRVGKRIARISQIFSEVMGPAAFNVRYRPILATQWAYQAIGEQQLKYIDKYVGAPKNLVYAIAGAPYFGLTSPSATQADISNPALTVNEIVQGMQAYVTTYYPQFKANMVYAGQSWSGATQKALANYYGIRSVAYEGGQDMGQSDVNLANKTLATKDPRIATIQADYWGQWFGCGNDLFLQYSVSGVWSRYGYWGLTNNPYDLSGPKYQSAKQVASTPHSNFRTCK